MDDKALERLLHDIEMIDADKSFTQQDHDMANCLFPDSRSQTRFQLTFNNSADGNNPAEREL
jgi:hypothetical protein